MAKSTRRDRTKTGGRTGDRTKPLHGDRDHVGIASAAMVCDRVSRVKFRVTGRAMQLQLSRPSQRNESKLRKRALHGAAAKVNPGGLASPAFTRARLLPQDHENHRFPQWCLTRMEDQ